MAVIVGIDEAGYGPILGPLMVSASVFEVPDHSLNLPLWDVLRMSTTQKRTGKSGRIVITDSKKLLNSSKIGKNGAKPGKKYDILQRGVLSCLSVCGENKQPPVNSGDLFHFLDISQGKVFDDLSAYPWYAHALGCPLVYNPDDIMTAGRALATDMRNNHIRLHGIWAVPLFSDHYNRAVAAAGNKATVLFAQVCRLIDFAYRRFGRTNLQVVIDKQSGRSHYRQGLQNMFPGLEMKIIKEEDHTSSYELSEPSGQHRMRVHFLRKGEDRQLPIALASMTAKYTRELFMEQLNAYFQQFGSDILPTAGYYQDGMRFLADLEKNLSTDIIKREILVRTK